MDIMVAEYAIGAGEGGTILLEGKAMLDVLVRSFTAGGHRVIYPTSGPILSTGTPFKTDDINRSVERLSQQTDAGLVVAPDEVLGDLTELVEENTVNLGCPSKSVRLCADKLTCTQILERGGIRVPKTVADAADDQNVFSPDERVVIKPRWGCACEDTVLTKFREYTQMPEGFIATEYIEGDHLSASLIVGEGILPLTVNRQNIKIGSEIYYDGGTVGIDSGMNPEIFEVASRSAKLLGCRGYAGVDIVLAKQPYVIEINPRPTTSIIGISRVMQGELGELILRARFGGLPEHVGIEGEFAFTKNDLG